MEEILVAIIQVLLEVVAQVLLELPWDISLGSGEKRARNRDREPNYLAWGFWSLLVGGAIGGGSLLVVPRTIIARSEFRIASLILTPVASAFVSARLSKISLTKDRLWNRPHMHAVCAFLFSLGFATIRFAYAKR